jgi:hypothetical protein
LEPGVFFFGVARKGDNALLFVSDLGVLRFSNSFVSDSVDPDRGVEAASFFGALLLKLPSPKGFERLRESLIPAYDAALKVALFVDRSSFNKFRVFS